MEFRLIFIILMISSRALGLEGTWSTGCLVAEPPRNHVFQYTVEFLPGDHFYHEYTEFLGDCGQPQRELGYYGTYVTGSDTNVPGAISIDRILLELQRTPLNSSEVEYLNRFSFCDHREWKLAKPYVIRDEADCQQLFDDTFYLGMQTFDILQVGPDVLRIGRFLHWKNEVDQRPTSFIPEVFYRVD